MLIRPPAAGSQLHEDMIRFGRSTEVVRWLEQNRNDILEILTQVPEETRLRQLQGAAVALKELLAIFNRTP